MKNDLVIPDNIKQCLSTKFQALWLHIFHLTKHKIAKDMYHMRHIYKCTTRLQSIPEDCINRLHQQSIPADCIKFDSDMQCLGDLQLSFIPLCNRTYFYLFHLSCSLYCVCWFLESLKHFSLKLFFFSNGVEHNCDIIVTG